MLRAFEDFAREKQLSAAVRQAADLAIEEHLTNILKYGFTDEAEHTIRLKFQITGEEFAVEISDDATAFDPTQHRTPDLTVPADKRAIGGLGIHMIRKSMDGVKYARVDGRNVLRMTKRIKG